ncbi:hypothetical protein ACFQZ4_30330 [Catellatospora coxensis]
MVTLLAAFLQNQGPVGLIAGWLVLLGAPLSGLLPAGELADRWFGARLDPGAIALTILAGMLATTALTLA